MKFMSHYILPRHLFEAPDHLTRCGFLLTIGTLTDVDGIGVSYVYDWVMLVRLLSSLDNPNRFFFNLMGILRARGGDSGITPPLSLSI